jgi:hypothetical protein
MRTVTLTKALLAAVDNAVCASQALGAAGNLLINGANATGGVATLATQRRIILTSGGDDHLLTATVTGTNQYGNPINQTVALTNGGVAATDLDFLTVTQVSVSGAVATVIKVGTNSTGSTQWVMPSFHLTPFQVTITTQEPDGAVTYSIETTQDNYWDAANPTTVPRVYVVQSGLTAATQQILDAAVTGTRLTVTSGTGTVTAEVTQAGIANY